MNMNILNILNNEGLKDIPILYILRIIDVIQKEELDERPSQICKKLYKNNESVKE